MMRRGSPDGAAAEAGLTLIELVVALAILGILLALSFSASGLVNNRRLAGAARVLAADIRAVQQQARAERGCWRIAFDPGEEQYHVQVLQGETAGTGTGCTPGRTGKWHEVRMVTLPPPIELARTTFVADYLVLSPFGNASPGGAVLQTPGGIGRAVTVGPQGSVTVGPAAR